MKRIYLSFLLLLPFAVHSQRLADVAVSYVVTNYIGDLGNEKNFPISSASSGAAVTLRNFIGNNGKSAYTHRPFDLQLRFSWHRLQYDEVESVGGKSGSELRNYLRGIGFRNDLFGAESGLTYNFIIGNQGPLSKPKFGGFVMAGVGAFYGKPKADLFLGDAVIDNRYYFWNDGSIRDLPENSRIEGNVLEKDGIFETDLRQWRTEGQGAGSEFSQTSPYNNLNIGIPMGVGLRYFYNKFLTLSVEFNYYYFFTDYLDDVSGRYATYEELLSSFPDQLRFELAKYISDPTGRGTNGFIGLATSPRGNPSLKDAFTFFSIEASYKIKWKKKGIYGQ
ncbi:MAG: hypothetical protein DWQ48_02735 [Bacteroidetes bacterium]|nr:MAG: hypothetical protein DWQ48_02735 [Bacteroidota bacterium]